MEWPRWIITMCRRSPLLLQSLSERFITLSIVSPTTLRSPVSWGKVTKNSLGAGNLLAPARLDRRGGQQQWERDVEIRHAKEVGADFLQSQKSEVPVKPLLPGPSLMLVDYVEIQIFGQTYTALPALQMHLSSSVFLSCAVTKTIPQCCSEKTSHLVYKKTQCFSPYIWFYDFSFLIYSNSAVP